MCEFIVLICPGVVGCKKMCSRGADNVPSADVNIWKTLDRHLAAGCTVNFSRYIRGFITCEENEDGGRFRRVVQRA